MAACTNSGILRVIYFFLLIIDVIKIIVPIALIVLGIIDFSKATLTSDDKVQKKKFNLFMKRILYAVLVFAVPWIVEVLMVTLGDLLNDEVNFTDCIQNANSETIEILSNSEKELDEIERKCTGTSFIINYYDEKGNKIIDSDAVCSNQNVTIKTLTKEGYTFKGWDFKHNSTGTAVISAEYKTYNFEFSYESFIKKHGEFNLVPMWE